MRKRAIGLVALAFVVAAVAVACDGGGGGQQQQGKKLVFGMLLVGPKNDHGWSQAHYEAGKYVEQKLGAQMIVLDKVNPADRPETSVEQAVSDMITQGAELIFATSDDMKDGIIAAAKQHPDVPMIWSSGDNAWAEGQDLKGTQTIDRCR